MWKATLLLGSGLASITNVARTFSWLDLRQLEQRRPLLFGIVCRGSWAGAVFLLCLCRRSRVVSWHEMRTPHHGKARHMTRQGLLLMMMLLPGYDMTRDTRGR